MLKLLAVTPFFSRSGSEIALLNLLESLKHELDISIFTPNTNPELRTELSNEITIIFPVKRKDIFRRTENIFKKIKSYVRKTSLLEEILKHNKFDLILLNTFLSLKHYPVIKKSKGKVILYVHETELMLVGLNKEAFFKILSEVDLILCSSIYVKKYLTILGRRDAIDILIPTLDFSLFNLPIKKVNIRKLLGFHDYDFIWGMSGATLINKNPKMFIITAQYLIKKNDKVKFIWIGTRENDVYSEYLQKLVFYNGLQDHIKFVKNQTTQYFEYLNEMNGFVLTSFSESFSLAALEASCFNKPVVSFPSGGILEAVPETLRMVTKEFSIKELAKAMLHIMNHSKTPLNFNEITNLMRREKNENPKVFFQILNKWNFI